MSLSIYSSWFNVVKMQFAWKEALTNWLAFLHGRGQIVIALNTSDDGSAEAIAQWLDRWRIENASSQTRIDIVPTSIPYEDPAFDGLIKAAALAHCVESFAILLDCDERVNPRQFKGWMQLAALLERSPQLDGLLIPVVDLMGDEKRYRSVGSKFYLHRNDPSRITRGVLKAARKPDGSIDTDLSDTTEPIYADTGELIRSAAIMAQGLPPYLLVGQLEGGEVPFVTHLGWLDAEQRLRQAEFWNPIWTARRGGANPEPKLTLADLEKVPRYRHNLPSWKESA